LNAQLAAELVVALVCTGGEARRQKGRLKGRGGGPHSLRVVQKTEREAKGSNIQKREGPGGAMSQGHTDVEVWAIERIKMRAEHLCSDDRGREKMGLMR
jgi:hypothetical protein